MANPFRDMGISDADLEREINASAEVIAEKRKTADEMVVFAKSIAPKRTGTFAGSIRVVKTKTGKIKVGSSLWYAHMLEYGTGPDKKGAKGKRFRPGAGADIGPDTPTPEFAVFARTAAAFGGTSDGSGDAADDDPIEGQ